MEASKLDRGAIKDCLWLLIRARSTPSLTDRGFDRVNPGRSNHYMIDIPARTCRIVMKNMAAFEHELVQFLADRPFGPQAERISAIKPNHIDAGDRA